LEQRAIAVSKSAAVRVQTAQSRVLTSRPEHRVHNPVTENARRLTLTEVWPGRRTAQQKLSVASAPAALISAIRQNRRRELFVQLLGNGKLRAQKTQSSAAYVVRSL
jgi:hypothetical protein